MKLSRILLLSFLIVCFIFVFYYNFYQYKYNDQYQEQNQKIKIIFFLVFLFVISTIFALIEIEIEGKHGWAVKLPTWVYKPEWIVNLLGGKYPTGYHTLLMGMFLPLFFHFPVFFTTWSWNKEFIVLGSLLFFMIIEDFMWFALNPNYGLKKFNSKNKKIWWHKKWFGPLPDGYLEILLVALIFFSFGLPYL